MFIPKEAMPCNKPLPPKPPEIKKAEVLYHNTFGFVIAIYDEDKFVGYYSPVSRTFNNQASNTFGPNQCWEKDYYFLIDSFCRDANIKKAPRLILM